MGALASPFAQSSQREPRWLRQWLRLTVMVVPAAIGWLVVHGALGAVAAIGPAGNVVVEAAVCGLTGVAGAAVAARYRHTSTAALAGPGTQAVLVAATLFLNGTYSPWPVPGEPGWPVVHRYWPAALPIIVVVLLLANRDTWPLRVPPDARVESMLDPVIGRRPAPSIAHARPPSADGDKPVTRHHTYSAQP